MGLNLRTYVDRNKSKSIAILFMSDTKIDCKEYNIDQFYKIPPKFLDMEVMDTNEEEDCTEIWIT